MSDTTTADALATDIRQRLDAINDEVSEKISDEKLGELVRGLLPDVVDELLDGGDSDFARKLRFPGDDPAERQLVGTKYARWGLSLADVEFLHDMQRSLAGQKRANGSGTYEGPSEELQRTFEAATEAFYLSAEEVERMDRKAIDDLFPRIPVHLFHGKDREHAARGEFELTEAYKRAMDTAESGYGSQLVGAQYVGELWEAPRRLGRVFPLIESFEMTDPTAYLPVEADLPEVLFVSESTANNSSNYSTTKTGSNRVQVNAKKFVLHQMWSGEMDEDSIIPFVPFLRTQAGKSIAHYSDSLVLNGDTTNSGTGNINLDDADPADTKHYLAFDGIRHAALVDNTGNAVDVGGAYTYGDFVDVKAKLLDSTYLMDWGHPVDPDDLVYVCDPTSSDKIGQLDEVLTVDKYGPTATVLNGELARIAGRHPLVSSVAVSKTEADGKVSTTGGNNTKGQTVVFNRRGFVTGWRRRVMLETERLPATDQTRLVYSMRLGFGRFSPTGAASGIEAAAVLYNASV